MEIAYIYSHDGDEHGIKFGVEICTEATLRETVLHHLHPDASTSDSEVADTFDGVFAQLVEDGSYDFEDGWIVIKRGAKEIVEFLIYQLREAKSEENYAHKERAEEGSRRVRAEEKYTQLQAALVAALGPNAPDVAAKAAA